MTTTKETCPKCGAGIFNDIPNYRVYACASNFMFDDFEQSDRCRITELEKEVDDSDNSFFFAKSMVESQLEEARFFGNYWGLRYLEVVAEENYNVVLAQATIDRATYWNRLACSLLVTRNKRK
jgi:hypothetical protein